MWHWCLLARHFSNCNFDHPGFCIDPLNAPQKKGGFRLCLEVIRLVAVLLVTNPFVSWLKFQPVMTAQRLGIETEEICISDGMGICEVQKKMASGGIDEVILISIHAVIACGGPEVIERFAETCLVPVTMWNVDCTPLVYRDLPRSTAIRYVHVSPSDAAYWSRHHLIGALSDCTYGVGPHRKAPESKPTLNKRSDVLLAPINLKWAGRSLGDLLAETELLPPWQRATFNNVFEETRAHPSVDIPKRVAALIDEDDKAIVKVSRYAIYASQLWRREWLMANLMDLPVVLDSNFWPTHLAKRIECCRATVLTDAQVSVTNDRMSSFRAVMTCSSSHDLYHDRVANGFNQGCLVVAERNSIYPSVQADAGIFYFDFERWRLEEIFETLSSSHIDDLQSMAKRGEQRFSDIYPNMGWTRLFAGAKGHPECQSLRWDEILIDQELLA